MATRARKRRMLVASLVLAVLSLVALVFVDCFNAFG